VVYRERESAGREMVKSAHIKMQEGKHEVNAGNITCRRDSERQCAEAETSHHERKRNGRDHSMVGAMQAECALH